MLHMAEPAAEPMAPAMRAYLASLLAMGGGRIARLGTLVVIGALVEGFGIMLIVPLLGLVFAGGSARGEMGGRLGAITRPLLAHFGRGWGLAVLLALFCLLAITRGAVLWRRDLGLMTLSSELVDRWRGRMISALARASWRRSRELSRGHVEFSINSDVSRLAMGSDRILRGIVAAIQLVVQVGVAIALSPTLALAALVLLLPAIPIGLRMMRAAHRFGGDLTRQGGRRHNALTEFMAGLKLAKAHDAQGRYADEFTALSTAMRQRTIAFSSAQMRGAQAYQIVAALLAVVVLMVGMLWLHLPPAVTSAVLLLFARLPAPVMLLAQGGQALGTMLPAVSNLVALESDLTQDTPAPSPPTATAANTAPLTTGPAALRLSGISFRHHPQGAPVLQDIDLTLGAGEVAALIGVSGGGKTTLADIMIGLTAPDTGTLSIDGDVVTGPEALARWRRQIGYVPQDPFLFDDTLRANLTWAAPDAGDDALWQALTAAEADGFVRAMPEGLSTRAGDRGSRLSGGERQRICLARALLRRPRLLVLDEATSALDAEVEGRLLETLARLRGATTMVMITHRLPVSFAVDQVWRLENGRIAR